jgi:hypothetical protein
MDAGKWIAIDRGAKDVTAEEVQQFESVEPATFPLADRVRPEELVALFALRERLPKMENGLPTEVQ